MYIKLTDGVPENYTISQLIIDNPQVSFPTTIPDYTLAEYDVYPLVATEQPEVDYTQNVTQGTPVEQDGEWIQVWVVTDATPEEIDQRTTDQASSVRSQRDSLLSNCDWIVIKSVEVEVPELEEWKEYRQALRDVPEQAGFPWDVVWPEAP
jgi:hypothetical protein